MEATRSKSKLSGLGIGGTVSLVLAIAVANYLLSMKMAQLPCGEGVCDAVINSEFGSVFGVPLPLLALGFWALFCLGNSLLRQVGAILIVLTCVALVSIQAFVLHAFCVLCNAHAALAIVAALTVRYQVKSPNVFILGLFIGWIGLFAVHHKELSDYGLNEGAARRTAVTAKSFVGFEWLGAPDSESPVLVVSFTCGHCLKVFNGEIRAQLVNGASRPKIMILAGTGNFELNRTVTAAILAVSKQMGPSEGFKVVMAALKNSQRQMLGGEVTEIDCVLDAHFPDRRDYMDVAARILRQQHAQLKAIGVVGTPFTLTADGEANYQLR